MAELHRNDFLAAEPDIVACVKEALADVRPQVHVLTARELSQLKEEAQPMPAIHVIWNGFQVLESREDGAASLLDHTWLVVAAVRNVRTLKTGEAARVEAGQLLARAGAALMGFRPRNVNGPMRLAPGPGAGQGPGVMYVPLAFKVETIFQRD